MPTTRSLEDIRDDARNLADVNQIGTGPRQTGDAEIYDRINESVSRLWDAIRRSGRGGEELLATRTELTVDEVGIQPPLDFYKLLRLDVLWGGKWVEVRALRVDEENDFQDVTGRPRRYAMRGFHTTNAAFRFYPDQGGDTDPNAYRIEYIPESPFLDPALPSTSEIELPNNWWQWIARDVAIYLMQKMDRDASRMQAMRDEILRDILQSAASTDYGEPRPIRREFRRRSRRRRRRFIDDGWHW